MARHPEVQRRGRGEVLSPAHPASVDCSTPEGVDKKDFCFDYRRDSRRFIVHRPKAKHNLPSREINRMVIFLSELRKRQRNDIIDILRVISSGVPVRPPVYLVALPEEGKEERRKRKFYINKDLVSWALVVCCRGSRILSHRTWCARGVCSTPGTNATRQSS